MENADKKCDGGPRFVVVDNAPGSWNTCRIVDCTDNSVVSHHVSHFHARQVADDLNAKEGSNA